MVKRGSDQQMFFDITAEVDRLLRVSEPTHADRQNLVLQSEAARKVGDVAPRDYTKLTAAKLAARLGVKTRTVVDRLIGHGYVQMNGGQAQLTDAGKRAGGEAKFSQANGNFIVWPADLKV